MRVADEKQVQKSRRLSPVVFAMGLAAACFAAGCGNQYRPVVSAINPVGPAGQPTKYAVAVSNTSIAPTAGGGAGVSQPGLLTFVDVSGDTIISTPSILNLPAPLTPAGAASGTQPAVSATPSVINPLTFNVNLSGTEGFVVNSQGTLENFGLSSPQYLLTTNIIQTSLAASAGPVSIATYSLPSTGTTVFIPESNLSKIAELTQSNGLSLLQEITVAANPVYVVGTDSAQRVYAISQGTNPAGNGTVAALEGSPVSISTTIPVGVQPVYGVMTSDGNRAFILNKGSGTISVINVPSNALDVAMPTITLPQIALPGGGTTAPNPVWADFSPLTEEMVVLNQGDGVHPGSLSIINIPLCNAGAQVTNPNCNSANPVDATGFGTFVATVPVGINPTMVSVLNDGSRAYVVNSGTLPTISSTGVVTSPGVEGSVSVVNLQSGTVTATIPAVSATNLTANYDSSPTMVYGHPNSIVAVTGTPTGKVYITSPDNRYLTILRTDLDAVDTHVSLQGTGVRVQATSK